MDLKKKLENAKAKIKDHAPEIAAFTIAAAGLAYFVYSFSKELKEGGQEVLLIPTSNSSDRNGGVILVDNDVLNKLSGDETFKLSHVDDDLYSMTISTDED